MSTIPLRRLWGSCFALLLLIGVAAVPRVAAAQQSGAEAFISNLGAQATQLLSPSVSPNVRSARFRQMFQSDFDMPEIAAFVLGPYRHIMSAPQQAEFRHLLADRLARTYARRLSGYAGESLQVYGSRPWSDGTLVYSRVPRREGNPIEIDWVVTDHGGHYQISDVYVDQVSMKLANRKEFAGIVQRNGGDPSAMLAALRQELSVGS